MKIEVKIVLKKMAEGCNKLQIILSGKITVIRYLKHHLPKKLNQGNSSMRGKQN